MGTEPNKFTNFIGLKRQEKVVEVFDRSRENKQRQNKISTNLVVCVKRGLSHNYTIFDQCDDEKGVTGLPRNDTFFNFEEGVTML